MQARPVIGLATQTQAGSAGGAGSWAVGQPYVRSLVGAGGLPWPVPLLPDDEATLRAVYDRLDGVFLTGGVDVDPARYGEARLPCCDEIDPARDGTELLLARWAAADGKPLLGVCRGCQLVNVACGGSLYQDIAAQRPGAIKHDYFSDAGHRRDYLAHPVKVEAGSLLARVLGAGELPVNSMHHQGVKRLAAGLRATAFAPDGLVEGFEAVAGGFLLGVQWHPEELPADERMRRLFTAFVGAARAR